MFHSRSQQSAELLLQVDRKVRGLESFLSEALEMDESHIRLTVSAQDLLNLGEKLKQIIAKHM